MKKSIVTDLICLLLIVTVIGIPIAIYLLRKREDYGKSDNILKPTKEVTEKKFEGEKRKFSPLYTETTILPVLTEEDLKKYKKEVKEEKKEIKEEKIVAKKTSTSKNNKKKKTVNNDNKNNKKTDYKKKVKTNNKKKNNNKKKGV